MSDERTLSFPGLFRAGAAMAVVGLLGLVAGAVVDREQFFHSYLLGFAIFLSLSLGALSLTMIHSLTAGAWGFMVRRPFEAAIANIPVMAVLSAPILLGLPHIYKWAVPEFAAADEVTHKKELYLNPKFFVIRMVFFLVLWSLYALSFRRNSLKLAKASPSEARAIKDHVKRVAGPGLVIFCVSITFAFTDLMMSLEPDWYSTIYGMTMGVIQALFALAFGIAFAAISRAEPLMRGKVQNHFHDLGNLMLGFTMLWGYVSLSQYLIIWSGNLPEEVTWYLARLDGSWKYFTYVYLFLHFAAPFLLLLFRLNKREPSRLKWVACLVIFAVVLDFVWFIIPAFRPGAEGMPFHWIDAAAILGIGGIWLSLFARNIAGRPLLNVGDPDLPAEFLLQKGVA